nr:MAG TPA: hypothetical protein [Caudoviricetes sp.]
MASGKKEVYFFPREVKFALELCLILMKKMELQYALSVERLTLLPYANSQG